MVGFRTLVHLHIDLDHDEAALISSRHLIHQHFFIQFRGSMFH